MSCNISKFDFCILQQETFTSPTFEFENTDVSNDTFVYTVFKSFGSEKKEFPVNFIDNNTVYIEDVKMPLGNYQHELLWIRNGIKEVVFQGSLKVTNKGSNCGCTSNKNIINVVNEDVVFNVNYSERVIERITDKGASAYQVALENGFVGTEEEWLESLKLHYSDLTEAEILELQQPAIEAAQTANTAAQNADDARLAIQDDLAQLGGDVSLLRDDATVKTENLVVNGDFSNGIDGWIVGFPGQTNLSVSNNILSASIIEGYTPNYAGVYQSPTMGADDVLYMSAMVSVSVNKPIILINDVVDYNLTPNVWTNISKRRSGQSTLRLYYRSVSTTEIAKFTNVITINLTQTFGAGNEPTKEEMDLLISILGINYFEGEITIPAQKIMQWQLAMIRQNRNAIIALGGTII